MTTETSRSGNTEPKPVPQAGICRESVKPPGIDTQRAVAKEVYRTGQVIGVRFKAPRKANNQNRRHQAEAGNQQAAASRIVPSIDGTVTRCIDSSA